MKLLYNLTVSIESKTVNSLTYFEGEDMEECIGKSITFSKEHPEIKLGAFNIWDGEAESIKNFIFKGKS